jgi:hypothetical protein
MTAKNAKDEDRRIQGMVPVALVADRVTRPIFGRHGFAGGALVMDWPAIVGQAVAAHTLPVRIKFPPKERSGGTLEIKVANSAFATELAHLEPLILERVNGYFGWNAVSRLRLKHGPLPQRGGPKAAAQDPPDDPRVGSLLAGIDDPALKEALDRLGRRIMDKG